MAYLKFFFVAILAAMCMQAAAQSTSANSCRNVNMPKICQLLGIDVGVSATLQKVLQICAQVGLNIPAADFRSGGANTTRCTSLNSLGIVINALVRLIGADTGSCRNLNVPAMCDAMGINLGVAGNVAIAQNIFVGVDIGAIVNGSASQVQCCRLSVLGNLLSWIGGLIGALLG